MHLDTEKQIVEKSLRVVLDILERSNITYRIIGSVLTAAHLNKVYRKINDIDIVLNKADLPYVVQELKKRKFKIKYGKKFGNILVVLASKIDLKPINFCWLGKFKKDYYEQNIGFGFASRTTRNFMRIEKYKLGDTVFNGIPIEAQLETMLTSKRKPGRKMDLAVLKKKVSRDSLLSNCISIYFFGLRLPFVYELFSFYKDYSGYLRYLTGRKYEMFS